MKQIFPRVSQPAHCVKPTGLVGFTQLAGAGIWATKRVFTQLGIWGELTNNHSSAKLKQNVMQNMQKPLSL